MPIALTCTCGKTLRARDEHAGRKTKCPACGALLSIPIPAPAVTGERNQTRVAAARPQAPAAPDDDPPEVLAAEPDQAITERSPRRPPRDDYTLDQRRSRSRERSRPEPKAEGGGFFGPEKSMFNGGILGGIGIMAAAAIWFFGALLLFDVIFFYPPILFIIGVAAFIKGLVDLGRRN